MGFRSCSGGAPDSRHLAEDHPQVLIIALFDIQKAGVDQIKEADAEFYEALGDTGFMLDFGPRGSGLFGRALTGVNNYYIDVGASQMIIDGKIKVASGAGVERLTQDSVVLEDGREIPADAVIYATGFQSMYGTTAELISQDVADSIGPVWGIGSGESPADPGPWEGEVRNMWKPVAQEALWFHGSLIAHARAYSKYLALQLKARMEGISTPVYGSTSRKESEQLSASVYNPQNQKERRRSMSISTEQSGLPDQRRAPHDADRPLITSRRGHLWIPGEVVETSGGTLQRGPLFAEWEAPENVRFPVPIVLVHGGGGQGTDWMTTPDGRPGWAHRLLESGFVVYVVDRPGHGRSPYHPDVIGEMGAPFPYEAANALFYPDDVKADQDQWTFARSAGNHEVDQLVAAMGPLPHDLAESQRMDGERLARLLDRIGPAVLITHSAGGPAGWLAADARPGLVKGVIAIEPIGPAFAELPGIGRLDWGLTAAPIGYSTTFATPAEAEHAEPSQLKIPALEGVPISVVTGGASAFAGFAEQVVDYLCHAGADALWVHLPEHGIEGNGHGLIFESNSDDAALFIQKHVIQRITMPEQDR